MKDLGGCLSLLAYLTFGACAIRYDLGFWMPYIVHHAVVIPFIPAAIGALFLGGPAVVIAVLTWIISFAM